MTVELKESTNVDRLLMQLPIEMRTKAIPSALRAHARPTATRVKQLTPRGVASHNPSKPPLYTTIKVVIREYGETVMAIVGASWPEGAHWHFVEEEHEYVAWGHRTGATLPGKAILVPAAEQTEQQGRRKMINKLVEMIKKAGG